MSRGIPFSKNKHVKCFSCCSLSPILISLSGISSCVGANSEENWGCGANHLQERPVRLPPPPRSGGPETKEGEASVPGMGPPAPARISEPDLAKRKKKIVSLLARSLCSRMKRRRGKQSTKRRRGGSSPHKTGLLCGEEGDPASTSTPILPCRSAGN